MNEENKLPAVINSLLLKLDEEQLRELNHKVVEKLKLIRRARSTVSMARFNLRDKVYFIDNGEKKIGNVLRLNPRSVTVALDNGHEWRIAPDFLTKI